MRLISDNVLLTFEIIHYMKTAGRRRRSKIALKIDINKAYDRVRWEFLEGILHMFGFDNKRVALIMNYVTTMDYFMRFNRQELDSIHP